jgi:Fe-S-cluster containining protein
VPYCSDCGEWCCYGEKIYFSTAERARLGFAEHKSRDDGSCQFLVNGLCSIYESRPLECRIFPFDFEEVDGQLDWIIWEQCPASPAVEVESSLDYLEREVIPKYGERYIWDYLEYSDALGPSKYDDMEFRIIRPVKIHNI